MKIQSYHNLISDDQIQDLLCNVTEADVSITFWNMLVTMSGYGHWKIEVDLIINREHNYFSKTTTDSMAYDEYKSNDDECAKTGFGALLKECINANWDHIDEICIEEAQEAEEGFLDDDSRSSTFAKSPAP